MAFLEGEEVALVALDPADETHVETYRRARNEPQMRATGAYGRCLTREAAREEIHARQDADAPGALCGIRVADDLVGWAGAWTTDVRARVVEVAYYVLPDHQGNGYAGDAVRLLVEFAFDELNAHSITAEVQADNVPSERLLETLGFREVGRRRDHLYKAGGYRDVTVWDLLATEFQSA